MKTVWLHCAVILSNGTMPELIIFDDPICDANWIPKPPKEIKEKKSKKDIWKKPQSKYCKKDWSK